MNKRVDTCYPVLTAIHDRWSPRSFSDRAPEPDKLQSMFEAARLAPSAHNTQPTRFLIARKHYDSGYDRLFQCLSAGNQTWAGTAPVLLLASAMRQRFSQERAAFVPYPHYMHDLGLAVMSLILQAQALGLHCHPMAGFDPDQARVVFGIPPLFDPAVVIAVGYLGAADALPESLREKELAPRSKRPLTELVYEGDWGQSSRLVAEGRP
jgi:nitroreductase